MNETSVRRRYFGVTMLQVSTREEKQEARNGVIEAIFWIGCFGVMLVQVTTQVKQRNEQRNETTTMDWLCLCQSDAIWEVQDWETGPGWCPEWKV